MFTGVSLLVVAGGLFWLAYRRPRPRRWWLPRPVARLVPAGQAIDRQHHHLRAGGLRVSIKQDKANVETVPARSQGWLKQAPRRRGSTRLRRGATV